MTRVTIAFAVLVACAPSYVAAQTLADVARAEEARRKTVEQTTTATTTKVYTNSNLKPDNTMSVPSNTTPDTPATPAKPDASADKKDQADNAGKDEAFWSGRLKEARDAVDRNKMFADALQSRINALNTDFVNRDDPAQRSVIEQDRNKALDELKKVQKEIENGTKAIADIQEEGRRAGVPAGWLR